jgi:hypothetical protein
VDDYREDTPTATKQAIEEHVTSSQVRSNALFARGVDAIREVSPNLVDKILTTWRSFDFPTWANTHVFFGCSRDGIPGNGIDHRLSDGHPDPM